MIFSVEVDDEEIRIHGRRIALESLMLATGRLRPEVRILSGTGAPERMKLGTTMSLWALCNFGSDGPLRAISGPRDRFRKPTFTQSAAAQIASIAKRWRWESNRAKASPDGSKAQKRR